MSQLIKDTNYTLAAFDKVRIVMVALQSLAILELPQEL